MLIPARGLTAKGKKRLIFSHGYRNAKEKVRQYLVEHYPELENSLAGRAEFYYTTASYTVYDNWLTKKSGYKQLRKKDVLNFIKNAEDVLFKFLGVDDSTIIGYNVMKGLNDGASTAAMQCVISLYEMDTAAMPKRQA